MNSFVSITRSLSLLAVLLIGFIACGIGGDTGRLSLSLTDATTDLYQAVYVTVKDVDVHAADDPADTWTTVATPNKTFNLLSLVNGVREELGLADLTAGHYTQMRLIIGDQPDNGVNILSQAHPFANYVIDTSDHYHELKVPSGMQTGVKIVQGFDINENRTTELILDFDASKSVVIAGRNGKFLLKPTIRVLSMSLASIITGFVTKAADQTVVEGALLSAQVFDGTATDIKDQVVVQTSTLSDDAGAYTLFIAAGPYRLVASKLGFVPLPAAITTVADQTLTQDFSLAAAEVGNVAGTATIAGSDDETFVTLSFRQTVSLGGEDVVIEIMSINVANGGNFSVELPAGLYSVISWTLGKTTQQADVTVSTGATTTFDVSF
jgi:hypothetical protein